MSDKFSQFAALHVPGSPVILYNIWDVGSARAVEKAGAQALATAAILSQTLRVGPMGKASPSISHSPTPPGS